MFGRAAMILCAAALPIGMLLIGALFVAPSRALAQEAGAQEAGSQEALAGGGAPSLDRLEGHGGPIRAIGASADRSRLFTSSFDNTVGVWRADDLANQMWLEDHDAGVNIAVSIGEGVLTGGDDFKIRRWSATGALAEVWEGHKGKLMDLAVAEDVVASAGWDGWIGLWSVAAAPPAGGAPPRRQPELLSGHQAGVNAVVFAGAAHETLFSASSDGTIRIWDVPSRALKRVMVKHGFGVNKTGAR